MYNCLLLNTSVLYEVICRVGTFLALRVLGIPNQSVTSELLFFENGDFERASVRAPGFPNGRLTTKHQSKADRTPSSLIRRGHRERGSHETGSSAGNSLFSSQLRVDSRIYASLAAFSRILLRNPSRRLSAVRRHLLFSPAFSPPKGARLEFSAEI